MNQNNIDRRTFLKSSALLASVGPFAETAASSSSRAPGPEIFFTRDEYVTRWSRVQAAMAAAGYENVLVWQRSASAYDRLGDVYWLTNFYTNGTGQDPYTEELDEPWTFAAVLIRKGHEPELHIGLKEEAYDASKISCGKVVTHTSHMTLKFAEYLRSEKIEGRVVVVGDHDLLTDATAQETASALAGSKVIRVPDCGHSQFADQPVAFLGAVSAFLTEQPRRLQ